MLGMLPCYTVKCISPQCFAPKLVWRTRARLPQAHGKAKTALLRAERDGERLVETAAQKLARQQKDKERTARAQEQRAKTMAARKQMAIEQGQGESRAEFRAKRRKAQQEGKKGAVFWGDKKCARLPPIVP